jgi:PAS domain S-box-containing protein
LLTKVTLKKGSYWLKSTCKLIVFSSHIFFKENTNVKSISPPIEKELLNKLPAGVIILKNREIYFVNSKARMDLGIADSKSEVNLNDILSFFVPSDRENLKRILASSATLPSESEWQAVLPNGETTWTQFRVASLGEDYDIVLIRNIGKYRLKMMNLDAKQKQYHDLFSKAPNFLFIFKDGCIDYYNQAFVDKLGYSKEEIEQKKCLPTFIVVPEDRKKIAQFILDTKRDLITGKIADTSIEAQYVLPDETTELELLCKDGTRIPVMAIVRRLYYDKSSYVQGVMIDLTPVRKLTDLKFDFLTLSQHSLRTPISNLKGYLDFYTKRLREGISEDEKISLENRMLSIFKRNVSQLEILVNDLTDISAIRQGKFKCTLLGEDFIPIIQQSIDDLELYLKRYRVHLIVDYPSTPLIINVDRVRMLQVLRNVFENAIRFTGHGTVEISVTTTSNNTLQIICQDSGVGISKEDLKEIGTPFMTFHSSASRLGLGSYLSKQIILDHGGTFEIESDGFNKGTKVTITIPLLIKPTEEELIPSVAIGIDSLVKQANSSQNVVKRLDAVQQLGSIPLREENEYMQVLTALEQIILNDKDRTIRNLASKFYTERKDSFERSFSLLK